MRRLPGLRDHFVARKGRHERGRHYTVVLVLKEVAVADVVDDQFADLGRHEVKREGWSFGIS